MALGGYANEGIVVIGEAVIRSAPDTVSLVIGAQTTGQNATQALGEHGSRIVSIVQTLSTFGVSAPDPRTVGVNIVPISPQQPPSPYASGTGWPQSAQPSMYGETQQVAGYHVSSSFKVALRDLNRVGELFDAAIKAGANFGIGLVLGLRDETSLRRIALETAGKDARSKAEGLAAALDKQLVNAVAAVEEFCSLVTPYSAAGAPAAPVAGSTAGAVPGVPVSLGELAMVARVRVTYETR